MTEGYRRQRFEAVVALLIWAIAGIWVITASYTLSAERPVRLIGGIPHWVVWGILVPWAAAFVAHTWFSLFFVGSGRED